MAWNRNPNPWTLDPEFKNLLSKHGMQADILMGQDGKAKLVVMGFDVPREKAPHGIEYDLTQKQLIALTRWGGATASASKNAYKTFCDIVRPNFDVPRSYLDFKNVNNRTVNMGQLGYGVQVGHLRLGAFGIRGIPSGRDPYGRHLRWNDTYNMRVAMRPGDRIQPGEVARFDRKTGENWRGSGWRKPSTGFWYKEGSLGETQQAQQQPVSLSESLSPVQQTANYADMPERNTGEVRSRNEMIGSHAGSLYWDKELNPLLAEHGIVVDKENKLLWVQPSGVEYSVPYSLTDEQVAHLTQQDSSEYGLSKRVDIINEVIGQDYDQPLTVAMLDKKEMIPLKVKEDKQAEVNGRLATLVSPEVVKQLGISAPVAVESVQPLLAQQEQVTTGQYQTAGLQQNDMVRASQAPPLNQSAGLQTAANLGAGQAQADGTALGQSAAQGVAAVQGQSAAPVVSSHGINLSNCVLSGSDIGYGQGWYRAGRDGRPVNVGGIKVEEAADHSYTLSVEINGRSTSMILKTEEAKAFSYMNKEGQLGFVEKAFDMNIKRDRSYGVSYSNEYLNSNKVSGVSLNAQDDFYLDRKYGRVADVGEIGVSADERSSTGYVMTAQINGEQRQQEISEKDYNRFMNSNDDARLEQFDKLFKEVSIGRNRGEQYQEGDDLNKVNGRAIMLGGKGWAVDVKHGRSVDVGEIRVSQEADRFVMIAQINGEEQVKNITAEQYQSFRDMNTKGRLKLFDDVFTDIKATGDFYGEYAGVSAEKASSQSVDEHYVDSLGKAFYRPGSHGREVTVGPIELTQENGVYKLKSSIDGVPTENILTEKQAQKFVALDDEHRLRMFAEQNGLKFRLTPEMTAVRNQFILRGLLTLGVAIEEAPRQLAGPWEDRGHGVAGYHSANADAARVFNELYGVGSDLSLSRGR